MDILTVGSAAVTVRDWFNDRAELPPPRTQRRRLLEHLAGLCASHSVAQSEDADRLREHLDKSQEILDSAWYATAPAAATKWLREGEEPSEEEKKAISRAQTNLWIRHDPKVSYLEGFESKDHFSCDKDSLIFTIAEYLSRPWLRHPVLDHIFLDMLVTYELCAFGEWIKEKFYASRDATFGPYFNDRYYDAKGRLSALSNTDWSYLWNKISMWFSCAVLVPLAAIWAAFYFGYLVIGWLLVGGEIAFWILKLVAFAINGAIRIIRGPSGRLTPHQRSVQLWTSMYDVWRNLSGPVVNPARVREMMQSTTDDGAVWDNSAWALIDRVVSIDRAVWVVADV